MGNREGAVQGNGKKNHSCNTWGFYHVDTKMKTQTENTTHTLEVLVSLGIRPDQKYYRV